MKKQIVDAVSGETTLVDFTAEEITQANTDKESSEAQAQANSEARENQETLKASAKAKLIAGEALTEDEANTIVL